MKVLKRGALTAAFVAATFGGSLLIGHAFPQGPAVPGPIPPVWKGVARSELTKAGYSDTQYVQYVTNKDNGEGIYQNYSLRFKARTADGAAAKVVVKCYQTEVPSGEIGNSLPGKIICSGPSPG